MAPLPPQSLAKTWRFRVNVDCDDITNDELHRATLLFEIKESIIGNGSGWTDSNGASITMSSPWVVIASSNSVTADASDNWADNGDLVWATSPTARSWIVLRHPNYFGAADPLEILIECSEAAAATLNATIGLFISRAGFDVTTPSTTARPTATDEVKICADNGTMATAAWCGSKTSDEDHRTGTLHFLMSDDGLNITVAICRLSATPALWHLFRMEEWVDTAMTIPAAMLVMSGDTDLSVATWSAFQSSGSNGYWYTRDNTAGGVARLQALMPVRGVGNTAASAQAACNIAGLAVDPFLRIVIGGAATIMGTCIPALTDTWWGRAASEFESFPDDGSRQFQNIGGIVIVPWNGTAMVTS